MRALVLEDDELVAELLQTIVVGLYPGAMVCVAGRLADAEDYAYRSRFDLFLVDWNLPDGSGLTLVRKVRLADSKVPIVIVSARADRNSVLNAAHHGISGYITKPFDVETVHQRLKGLLKPGADEGPPAIGDLLATSLSQGGLQLASDVDPAKILALMNSEDELSSAELAAEWRKETALTIRLTEIANSSAFRRTGKPMDTLQEAINLMGVHLALQQALALSLDVSGQTSDAGLKQLMTHYRDQSLDVAGHAESFAKRLGKSPAQFYKAGLLSRIGELSVLSVLNQFRLRGGELGEGEAGRALAEWAQRYGNALKVQWRLPLGLREMIGAVHMLPPGTVREDLLIMRAATLVPKDIPAEDEEYHRLLRRIGLDVNGE
ncbi:response regulator [Marinobacter lacisalsi]|uniref:Response regulator n=1 Tax=Marinobacter lacisalsi TaxID=475979 RepID=A0ABV8QE65_9GAMM